MHIPNHQSTQSIPTEASKVFEGVIFDVYQWQQTMYDGTTQTFEKLARSNDSSVVAITGELQFILQKETQSGKNGWFWSLPAGCIEKNENPLDGAKRELLEESGYISDSWRFWQSHQRNSKIESTDYYFVANNCEWSCNQDLDSGEKIEVVLCDFEEFIKIVRSEQFRDSYLKIMVLEAIVNNTLKDLKNYFLGE